MTKTLSPDQLQQYLEYIDACESAREFCKGKTLTEALAQCGNPFWIIYLYYSSGDRPKLDYDAKFFRISDEEHSNGAVSYEERIAAVQRRRLQWLREVLSFTLLEADVVADFEARTLEPVEASRPSSCDCDSGNEPHGCPYREELESDYETQCTCCAACTRQCAQDI